MEHTKKVNIIDGFTFVITDNNALFLWGMGGGVYSPTFVAHQVKEVAFLGSTLYQYLTTSGEVFAIDCTQPASFYAQKKEPIVDGIRSLCNRRSYQRRFFTMEMGDRWKTKTPSQRKQSYFKSR